MSSLLDKTNFSSYSLIQNQYIIREINIMEDELFMLNLTFAQSLIKLSNTQLQFTTNKYIFTLTIPQNFPSSYLHIVAIPPIENLFVNSPSILTILITLLVKYDLVYEKQPQKQLEIMDTHAHFLPSHFEKFSLNFNHTLQNFNSKIVIIATNPTEWSVALELANQNKQLYFTVGIHPYFVIKNIAELDQNCILLRQFIEENIKNTKLVAIGESGISVEEHQITEFKAQKRSLLVHCELSKKYGKCLITHCHKESQQRSVLQIVKQFKIKGISHGFGGTMEQAQQLNDMGWKGSMNSFSSAKKIASIIKHVGYKFILLETDSPYGAVIGGPEQVVEIATRLSQALDISLSELVEKCNQNAKDIYKYQ